jgi:hypothetical protein
VRTCRHAGPLFRDNSNLLNYSTTFIGNWVYGEFNGVLSAAEVEPNTNALNFSGNYVNFPSTISYINGYTNAYPGVAVNIEVCSAANICGNTLVSGGYGLQFADHCGTALVMMNNFSGVTYGAVGSYGANGFLPSMQSAQILGNTLASPVMFDVQLPPPFTNTFNWFLYQNEYINSATNSVPPFIDPAASAIHISNSGAP